MKKTNRIMSMLLAVIMVVCMLPVSVFAADTYTLDVQYYGIVDEGDPARNTGGTITVTDPGSYAEGTPVTITVTPDEDNGYCAAQWYSVDLGLGTISAVNGKTEHTFDMPASDVLVSITFVQHSYISYTDLGNGTHQNKCFYCGILNGEPEEHIDETGAGDSQEPNGVCDKCSADMSGLYTLTFDYSIPNEKGIEIGAGISNKTAEFESGTVVDLSEYWPSELTDKVEETTYYFAGFTKKDDIKILDSVAVDSNIILEAVWVTQEKITVTFETQGGVLFGGTRKSRVNKGYDFGTLNQFHIPTREDYVFTGWCLKNIGLPEDDLTELTEDTTVYAIWKWNKQPAEAWWSEEVSRTAMWTAVDGIDNYIVTLYEAESNGRIVSKIVSNGVTEYIFNSPVIFDENKSFYFTVMACLGNLKSYETKSDESKPFTIASIDGAVNSTVTVISEEGKTMAVAVKVIEQGGSRVALTDDVLAFVGKKIDVPVADADKLAISKTAIKINLGLTDEDAEITLEKAKIILADWREIVNTAEGEEQIKKLLPDYSIYELALLIQANNIIGPDDDTEEKLNRLLNDERERQKEAAANTQISFGETKVTMDADALISIEKALANGEYVAISAKEIDVTGLADDEVLFDSGALTGSVIFTEQELLDLKVIEEDNDEITWNELKYLYHYMTITELKSLVWFIEDFLYNTDPQVLVWLAEMIERDTIKPLNMQELMDMADLTDEQWELLADADLNDPPIGHLRQADLTVEQMRGLYGEVRILIGELNDNDKLSNCNELLGWLDDAIAAKEWEADKSQSQPSWAYAAKETVIGGVNINFDAVKVNGTTNAATEVRSITASGELAYTIPVNSNFDLSKGTVIAYKVGDDGSLNIKKVVVNADGTVTIQSDSNSTYIVTFEPAKADVDDTPTTPETPDSPQTGDNSHMWLWVALLFVSGAGLAGTTIYGRKKRTN